MALFAEALGGLVPIYLISLLAGRFFLKNLNIQKKIIYSTIIGFIVSILISGFGAADGGPYNPFAMMDSYILSSLVLIAIRSIYHKRFKKH